MTGSSERSRAMLNTPGRRPPNGGGKRCAGSANGVLQGGAAIHECSANLGGALESQQRMRERVVADDVPGGGDFVHDIGTLLHAAADQKKSGVDLMPGKYCEQAQRVRVGGTIVDRKSSLLGSAL